MSWKCVCPAKPWFSGISPWWVQHLWASSPSGVHCTGEPREFAAHTGTAEKGDGIPLTSRAGSKGHWGNIKILLPAWPFYFCSVGNKNDFELNWHKNESPNIKKLLKPETETWVSALFIVGVWTGWRQKDRSRAAFRRAGKELLWQHQLELDEKIMILESWKYQEPELVTFECAQGWTPCLWPASAERGALPADARDLVVLHSLLPVPQKAEVRATPAALQRALESSGSVWISASCPRAATCMSGVRERLCRPLPWTTSRFEHYWLFMLFCFHSALPQGRVSWLSELLSYFTLCELIYAQTLSRGWLSLIYWLKDAFWRTWEKNNCFH